MRRALVIALCLIGAVALVIIPGAVGADDGPYKVRGIFDNGGFIVNGEEVRIAGATVGTVESVDVTGPDETASLDQWARENGYSTRSAAIRTLIERGLAGSQPPRKRSKRARCP